MDQLQTNGLLQATFIIYSLIGVGICWMATKEMALKNNPLTLSFWVQMAFVTPLWPVIFLYYIIVVAPMEYSKTKPKERQ